MKRGLGLLVGAMAAVASMPRGGDGIALMSTSHPVGPAPEPPDAINPDSVVTTAISLTPYARAGEVVTCENGHPICEFVTDVYIGQNQDLPTQLGAWLQQEPVVGGLEIPVCEQCGAAFYKGGGFFHFEDGWRDNPGPGLKTAPMTNVLALPDRVSIDPASPYYRADYTRIGVRFDDKIITNCAEYCVSENWAKVLVSDGRGNWLKERGKPRSVMKPGKVEPYWKT